MVGARQHEAAPVDEPRERLAVPVRHAGARGEQVVEPLELREPERARDVGEAVVEAEPVVVEPAHVGRAALVALGVDPLLLLGRADHDHAALARRDLLVGVEPEDRGMPAPADRRAVGMERPERLAGVLDDRQAVALERRDVGRVAEDVDRQQSRGAPADHRRRGGRVEAQRDRVDVGEHRPRGLVDRRIGGRDERERRRDDLVAGADPRRAQRQMQPGRAGRDGAGVARRRSARRTPPRMPARACRARAGRSAAPRARPAPPPRRSPAWRAG